MGLPRQSVTELIIVDSMLYNTLGESVTITEAQILHQVPSYQARNSASK